VTSSVMADCARLAWSRTALPAGSLHLLWSGVQCSAPVAGRRQAAPMTKIPAGRTRPCIYWTSHCSEFVGVQRAGICNDFQIRTLAKQVGMILHCLDVVHLAPDLRNAAAEIGGQVIESHLLELKSGAGNGLQGGFQRLEVAAQDLRPWSMLWGGLVDCRPYVEPRRLHDAGHIPIMRTEKTRLVRRRAGFGGGDRCDGVGIIRSSRQRYGPLSLVLLQEPDHIRTILFACPQAFLKLRQA
jgi:hypothetical protein